MIKNNHGSVIVIFAIAFPIFMMLMIAVVDLGMYFSRQQDALNSLENASNFIISNPYDPTIYDYTINNADPALALQNRTNFLCAMPYEQLADAKEFGCTKGQWQTQLSGPNKFKIDYFVAIEIFVKNDAGFNFASTYLSDISEKRVVSVAAIRQP